MPVMEMAEPMIVSEAAFPDGYVLYDAAPLSGPVGSIFYADFLSPALVYAYRGI